MQTLTAPPPLTAPTGRAALITGRVLSGLVIAFLLLDSIGKVLELAPYVQGTQQVGFPASTVLGLGLLELACVLLYLVPRTSLAGALLLTGWLGGAIATHVRNGDPLFTHTLAPIYFAAFIWGGLLLRRPSLRAALLAR